MKMQLNMQRLEVFEDIAWVKGLFKEFMTDDLAYFFMVRLCGEFGGYCAVHHYTMNAQHFLHIMDIRVLPNMRRKGLAKALMNKIIDFAKALKLDLIKLEVEVNNTAAFNL